MEMIERFRRRWALEQLSRALPFSVKDLEPCYRTLMDLTRPPPKGIGLPVRAVKQTLETYALKVLAENRSLDPGQLRRDLVGEQGDG